MTPPDLSREAVASAVGPGLGAGVLSGDADVLPVPIPGVVGPAVWLVRDDRLAHPLQAYVGRWPGGEVRVLSDDQEAWSALMAATGVQITDPATALAYVRQFLEVTRGPSVIVREVAGPADLPWRPGSTAEEERRAAFLSGPAIEAPVADGGVDGFHVEVTLVVDQRVQRNMFDVTDDGRISASFRVLADELPLPIAR